jgi:predicted secreted Zn-dependent protease
LVVPTPLASSLTYPIAFSSTFKVITYTVTGKSFAEISNSLNSNTLTDPHDPLARFYARTDWRLARSWTTRLTLNGCEIDRGDVSLGMTMTLPALVPTAGVPSDVLARWSTFVDRLVVHEAEHVRINLEGARRLQDEIGNIQPAPSCDALNSQVIDLSSSRFKAIDQEGANYDDQTNHGQTQGAKFP